MSVESELLEAFEAQGQTDLIEIMEDAKSGNLTELELVESIGLVYDQQLNKTFLTWLEEQGVTLIYLTDDEEEGE